MEPVYMNAALPNTLVFWTATKIGRQYNSLIVGLI